MISLFIFKQPSDLHRVLHEQKSIKLPMDEIKTVTLKRPMNFLLPIRYTCAFTHVCSLLKKCYIVTDCSHSLPSNVIQYKKCDPSTKC